MPNIRSAKKRMRQAVTRRARNRTQRAALRTAIRKVRAAASRDEAQTAYRSAETLLDRAARKRLIHPNTAARYKARLAKTLQRKAPAGS